MTQTWILEQLSRLCFGMPPKEGGCYFHHGHQPHELHRVIFKTYFREGPLNGQSPPSPTKLTTGNSRQGGESSLQRDSLGGGPSQRRTLEPLGAPMGEGPLRFRRGPYKEENLAQSDHDKRNPAWRLQRAHDAGSRGRARARRGEKRLRGAA